MNPFAENKTKHFEKVQFSAWLVDGHIFMPQYFKCPGKVTITTYLLSTQRRSYGSTPMSEEDDRLTPGPIRDQTDWTDSC